MAKLTNDRVAVGVRGEEVVLQLGIDGRQRTFMLSPGDALLVSNKLGNAAADIITPDIVDRLPNVQEARLLPFGHKAGPAHAVIRFDTDEGPLMLRIDAYWLEALAKSADAALELAQHGGRA